uniref:heat shock transcription factor, X-linked member 3-like n=1 Tax=Jaculus jaculus TaxID=51337 RepID=UPI001E1B131D|nr:heat shock transcription factor, X-linked member 3-like [Jaculus jaculus]
MDTQSIKENDETIREPVIGEEPARAAPSEASCNPNGDTGAGSEAQSAQGMSRDPSLRENLQAEEPDQHAASEEGTSSLLGLSFPRKLWAVVENEAFKSVGWSEKGDTVKIEGDLFETEVFQRSGADKIFEMDSLKCFICQLNLHGFRNIHPDNTPVHYGKQTMMIYQNANFQRDKPELLQNIWRRGDGCSSAQEDPCCKRRKVIFPQRSPCLQKKEENPISLKEAPNDLAPVGQDTLVPTGITGCPVPPCPPQGHSVPCGQCSPENGTVLSPASDKIEGSGQVSIRSSWFPNWGSVISLYNKCSSMLKAAMSAISLSELSDGEREEDSSTSESSDEEEQEGFRQNKCVICELLKGSSRW